MAKGLVPRHIFDGVSYPNNVYNGSALVSVNFFSADGTSAVFWIGMRMVLIRHSCFGVLLVIFTLS